MSFLRKLLGKASPPDETTVLTPASSEVAEVGLDELPATAETTQPSLAQDSPFVRAVMDLREAASAPVNPSIEPHDGMVPTTQSLRQEPTAPSIAEPRPPEENVRDSPLAHEELHRIRRDLSQIFERTADKVRRGELGLIGWGLTLPAIQKLLPEHEGKPWFFVGDIHGDFLAWHRLFERVRQEKEFRLCFLGDLVDRGPLSIECFAALLENAEKYPGQILWIMGNHDEGVRWDRQNQRFASSTQPAEFVEWLNTVESSGYRDSARTTWGHLFIEVAHRLPRAVLFGDGLLATHGGFPLRDVWPHLVTMEAFHSWRAMKDFTWGRCEDKPRNAAFSATDRPYSESRSGYGYRDLEDFCGGVESVYPVKRIIRGHDHVPAGFEISGSYKINPVLTLTGAAFINSYGMSYYGAQPPYRQNLVIAIAQTGQLPRLEMIAYRQSELHGVYPDEPSTKEAESGNSATHPTENSDIDISRPDL